MSNEKKRFCGKLRSRRFRSTKVVYSDESSDGEEVTDVKSFACPTNNLTNDDVNSRLLLNNKNDSGVAESFKNSLDETNSNVITEEGNQYVVDFQQQNSDKSCDSNSSDCSNGYECDSSTDSDSGYKSVHVQENKSYLCDDKLSILEKIKVWAKSCHIKQDHVTELLKILKPHIPELPKSAKTLFKCDYNYNIVKLTNNDEYVYFGLSNQLQKTVNPEIHENNELILQFHVDGFSPYNSSKKEFWPLLCKIFFNPDIYEPFNVATYFGESKPADVNQYLQNFVDELNALLKTGIVIKEKQFTIKIMCFICDRPARAFMKQIKGHSGYFACERCVTEGSYYKNRVIFPDIGDKRTDESFRNIDNVQHHNAISLLVAIEPKVDMVNDFPLETMHLGCSGVQDRLLNHWSHHVLSKVDKMKLSMRMQNLANQIPSEFQRSTRSLGLLHLWKANELNFFLKYCGPLVLKDVLPEKFYQHFLLLHMAFRILSSEHLISLYLNNARQYLQTFFTLAKQQEFYGLEFTCLNVHSLWHLCDDVDHFKCDLTRLSAFPFEGELGKIKSELRSGYKPLQQLCRRQAEKDTIRTKVVIPPIFSVLSFKKNKETKVITKIKYKNFIVSLKTPDNTVILKNKKIMKVIEICKESTEYSLIGIELCKVAPAYLNPPNACKMMDMTIVQELHNNSELTSKFKCSLNDVQNKIVLMNVYELEGEKGIMYAIPLLHTKID